MMARHPEVTVVLNADNHGFAKANNQGLAQSASPYLALLNNDTIVTPGWLHVTVPSVAESADRPGRPGHQFRRQRGESGGLVSHLGRDGAVATECARRHDGEVADIEMLAMFCVAMRRDTYERVGPLDERFGSECSRTMITRNACAGGLSRGLRRERLLPSRRSGGLQAPHRSRRIRGVVCPQPARVRGEMERHLADAPARGPELLAGVHRRPGRAGTGRDVSCS